MIGHFYRLPCSEMIHKSLKHGGITTCLREEMQIASYTRNCIKIMSVAQEMPLPVSNFRLG